MITLGLAESFKIMNQPDLARPNRDAFWRLISRKVLKIRTIYLNLQILIRIMIFQTIYDSLETIHFSAS